MNSDAYKLELLKIVDEAIDRLKGTADFELYSLSIWTDVGAGASSVSADSFANSERVQEDDRRWMENLKARMLAKGETRFFQEGSSDKAPSRNTEPAAFLLPNIASVDHTLWVMDSEEDLELRKQVDRVLALARDYAVSRCKSELLCHPDAEVAISSREDWYDFPVRIFDRS